MYIWEGAREDRLQHIFKKTGSPVGMLLCFLSFGQLNTLLAKRINDVSTERLIVILDRFSWVKEEVRHGRL